MGINTIDLFHHLMDRYGKTREKDLKESKNIFDEALVTTMPIETKLKELMTESSMQMMEIIPTQPIRS